jgi:hypothetical protein
MGVGDQHNASAASPPVKSAGTHCERGWVGLRAGLDGYGADTLPHRGSNPRPPSQQQADTSSTLSRPLLVLIRGPSYGVLGVSHQLSTSQQSLCATSRSGPYNLQFCSRLLTHQTNQTKQPSVKWYNCMCSHVICNSLQRLRTQSLVSETHGASYASEDASQDRISHCTRFPTHHIHRRDLHRQKQTKFTVVP